MSKNLFMFVCLAVAGSTAFGAEGSVEAAWGASLKRKETPTPVAVRRISLHKPCAPAGATFLKISETSAFKPVQSRSVAVAENTRERMIQEQQGLQAYGKDWLRRANTIILHPSSTKDLQNILASLMKEGDHVYEVLFCTQPKLAEQISFALGKLERLLPGVFYRDDVANFPDYEGDSVMSLGSTPAGDSPR